MKKTLIALALAVVAVAAEAGERRSIESIIADDPRLSVLTDLLETTELAEMLAHDGAFTLYAPTDAAFANLPEGVLDTAKRPENADLLQNIMRFHVDDRKLTTRQLVFGTARYKPLMEEARMCITRAEQITIDDNSGDIATVTEPNIRASNGVIHVIDKVLVPSGIFACAMS